MHLLNYVWPNIFETSPHLISAVLEAVEALRVSLGPQRLLTHVMQGLFHPARRVREVYWRVYNTIYVASPDAMVPALPRLLDDEAPAGSAGLALGGRYRRTHLELFL